MIRDYKKPSKRYGKTTKKQERLLKMQQITHSKSFIVCEIVFILIVAIAGLIVFLKCKEQEQAQEQQVQAMAVEQQEHEVQEVIVTHGDNIVSREDAYYEALELLAHLIYAESGSDSEEEMWYTGSVVLNRIANANYPNDLESVIYQRGQYQVTWNGALYREEPSDIAYEVAAELLNSGSILPEQVIYQSEFAQGSGTFEKINRTYYCYE